LLGFIWFYFKGSQVLGEAGLVEDLLCGRVFELKEVFGEETKSGFKESFVELGIRGMKRDGTRMKTFELEIFELRIGTDSGFKGGFRREIFGGM